MKSAFDLNDPFYRPLWLRITIVVVAFAWAAFELMSGSPLWSLLFAVIGAYAVYGFFISFNPREPEARNDKPE